MPEVRTSPSVASQAVGNFYAHGYKITFYREGEAKVVDADGNPVDNASTITLSSLTDSEGQQRTYVEDTGDLANIRNFVSQLVVEGISESAFKAVVTFTPPYEEAIRIIENELLTFNTIMKVQWGYFGGDGEEQLVSDEHLFRIVNPSCDFGLQTTITIEGRDIFHSVAKERSQQRPWNRNEFKRDVDILKQLAREMRLEVEERNEELMDPANSIFEAKPSCAFEQNESNLEFFRKVCQGNNVGFYTIGRTIYLYDNEYVMRRKRKYRLLWMLPLQSSTDIPVSNVRINALRSLFQGSSAARGQKATQPNLDSLTTTSTTRDDSTLPDRGGGTTKNTAAAAKAGAGPATNVGGNLVQPNPPMKEGQTGDCIQLPSCFPNAEETGKRAVRMAGMLSNNSAQVTIPGVPRLNPQMLVELEGVSTKFSGLYLVRRVKHVLGARYTTELELFARSSDSDPRGEGAKALGTNNPTKPITETGALAQPHDADGNPVLSGGEPTSAL